jgi:DNA replication regulator SLD3
VPSLKREASENPSLSAIPLFPDKPKRRDSMASLKHLKARQINLSQFSATSSQNRKRKAQANDDQIKEAIAGIKKPNRGLIGREVAEEREKRGTGPKKNARSSGTSSKPDRRALHTVPNVQVLATPHHGRRTDVFAHPVQMPQLQPSPEIDVIPSSGVRAAPSDVVPGTEVKRSIYMPSSHFVTETPSRGPARTVLFESIVKKSDSSAIRDSAIASRTTTDLEGGIVAQTPSKGPSRTFSLNGGATKRTGARPGSRQSRNEVPAAVAETPLKKSAMPATPLKSAAVVVGEVVPSTPAPAVASKRPSGAKAEKGGSGSIYDALGWDDDDIDELA